MYNDAESPQAQLEPDWPDLQRQLDELRGHVERMLMQPDVTDIYGRFAGMASAILERAPPDLVESVHSELGSILRDLNLTGDSAD